MAEYIETEVVDVPIYKTLDEIDIETAAEVDDVDVEVEDPIVPFTVGVDNAIVIKGDPGYTPIKGVDYFDGAPGEPGHTPVLTSSKSDGVTTIYSDGEVIATISDGQKGEPGENGDDRIQFFTYEESTYNEIKESYTAGKIPVVESSTRFYSLSYLGRTYADFCMSDDEKIWTVRVTNANEWQEWSAEVELSGRKVQTLDDSETHYPSTKAVGDALANKQDTISDLATIRSGAAKGATALQSFTETDPTVPAWAKAANKPSYSWSEIGNKPSTFSPSGHKHFPIDIAWGGADKSGGVTPLMMSMSSEHSANRLAFVNPDAILFEYSSDAGTNWTTRNISDEQKTAIFTSRVDVPIGRASSSEAITLNSRERITISANRLEPFTQWFYFAAKRMMIDVNTAMPIYMDIETKTGNGDWTVFRSNVYLSGWSGWNDVDFMATVGGSSSQKTQIWWVRLTFRPGGVSANYDKQCSLFGIRIYADNCWAFASMTNGFGNLSRDGHLYTIGNDGRATFPKNVYANEFKGKLDWSYVQNKPTYTASEVGALPADTELPSQQFFVINEDDCTITTDATKGVAPYSTSYGYTNVIVKASAGVEWVEGAWYTFIVDTKLVVSGTYRNVRISLEGEKDANGNQIWHPLMGYTTSIIAGSTYLVKNMTVMFQYKSTIRTEGALHLYYDSNTTYAYLVNTVIGDATSSPITIDSTGYGARYSLIFPTTVDRTKWSSLVKSSANGSTKAATPCTFYAQDPIYIYSANVVAGAKPINSVYQYYQAADLRYTANTSSTYLPAYDRAFLWLKDFNMEDKTFKADATVGNIVGGTKLGTRWASSVTGSVYLYWLGYTTATWYQLNPLQVDAPRIWKYTPSTGTLVPWDEIGDRIATALSVGGGSAK